MWIKRRVFLFCALALASFSHAAQDDAKPPAWQVKGFWAALNDENPQVMVAALQKADPIFKPFGVLADRTELFAALGGEVKNMIPRLTELLRDPDPNVRRSAAVVLGEMVVSSPQQADELVKQLQDVHYFDEAVDLGKMRPHDLRTISTILPIVYDDSSRVGEIRFWAHFLGGGDQTIEIILAWLADPIARPTTAIGRNHDLAVKTLHVFEQA